MNRIALTVAGLLLATAGSAVAQGPSLQPSRSPTLSPYLDLLNRGNSLEFNYYRRYRPFREINNFQRQTAEAVRDLRREARDPEALFLDAQRRSNLSPTGTGPAGSHLQYFGTERGYFNAGGGPR